MQKWLNSILTILLFLNASPNSSLKYFSNYFFVLLSVLGTLILNVYCSLVLRTWRLLFSSLVSLDLPSSCWWGWWIFIYTLIGSLIESFSVCFFSWKKNLPLLMVEICQLTNSDSSLLLVSSLFSLFSCGMSRVIFFYIGGTDSSTLLLPGSESSIFISTIEPWC